MNVAMNIKLIFICVAQLSGGKELCGNVLGMDCYD